MPAAFRLRLEGHVFPRFLLGQHGLQQFVVQRVARLVRGERANDVVAAHEQIADGVQHFVTYEFVFETQAVFVQHAVVVYHDGAVEAAARAEPRDCRYSMSRINPKVRARLI